jgi:hypothetical protein
MHGGFSLNTLLASYRYTCTSIDTFRRLVGFQTIMACCIDLLRVEEIRVYEYVYEYGKNPGENTFSTYSYTYSYTCIFS